MPLKGVGRAILAVALAGTSVFGWVGGVRAGASSDEVLGPVPVFAYYYIWFNPTSWNRAKTDWPALGRYSSDEESVMRQHIEWAKSAGIRGFIVSWKSTETLNERLDALIRISDEEDFNLAIIYEGLDFYRQPLPVEQIRADLSYFAKRWARDRAFDLFGRPVVIWSGTWEFTARQVKDATARVRSDLLILASEGDPRDYGRLAHLVDGDAYYWASIDPYTSTDYQEKLIAMGGAVHAHNGLWFAPAAPGFDARLIGGQTVVEREGGETLRKELSAAERSSPDLIGLISWNEFSENTHIEPSRRYGSLYLRVLADALKAPAPAIPDFDSSAPQGSGKDPMSVLAIAVVVLVTLASVVVMAWRRERERNARRA